MSNKYLFTGEQYDSNLGDYYLRARYYDSDAGRFTSKDAYEGRLLEPLTLHKYVYTHNNSVNRTDPTGLFAMAEFAAAESIRNVLAGIQVDTGQRLIGMALGDETTPGDFARDNLIGLALIAAVPLLGLTIAFARRAAAIGRLASRTIVSRGLATIGTCDECAELIKTEFIRHNISGRHIRLETGSNRGLQGLIWDDGTQRQIATAGYHEAIVVDIGGKKIAFDNVYPQGKPFDQWRNDLVTHPGTELKVIRDEPFSP